MSNRKYDIANGGLEQLIVDLEGLKKSLSQFNNQLADDLINETLKNVQLNASSASEEEQVDDIMNKNVITRGSIGNEKQIRTLVNESPKAVFAEFGYGIVGSKSPYNYNDFIDMKKADWLGYDKDSIYKQFDRSWYYYNRNGQLVHTSGSKPKNIFYRASVYTKRMLSTIAIKAFGNRW